MVGGVEPGVVVVGGVEVVVVGVEEVVDVVVGGPGAVMATGVVTVTVGVVAVGVGAGVGLVGVIVRTGDLRPLWCLERAALALARADLARFDR